MASRSHPSRENVSSSGRGVAGRPREFDADLALRKAIHLFWKKGFRDTSINDLCEATGVLSGSLYAAFGDKRKLYLAALDQYIDGELARVNQSVLSNKVTYSSLNDALLYYTRISSVVLGEHGCFGTNAAIEFAPDDVEVSQRIERMYQRISTTLSAAIEKGQGNQIFANDVSAKLLADHLLCVIQGLHVLKRVIKNESRLRSIVSTSMRVLEPRMP